MKALFNLFVAAGLSLLSVFAALGILYSIQLHGTVKPMHWIFGGWALFSLAYVFANWTADLMPYASGRKMRE